MVAKQYDFADGAVLGEHSRQKHRIVREYFRQYVKTRCQLPQRTIFRVAIVDGFAGGGRYSCGSPGSPLIFVEELLSAIDEINVVRAGEGFRLLDISCLLILNDADKKVVEILRENIAPVLAMARENQHLHIEVVYGSQRFEEAYAEIKTRLLSDSFHNVIFNLDQCGHSHVKWETLSDIVSSFKSSEIFYTFLIDALLTFSQQKNPRVLEQQFRPFGITLPQIQSLSADLVTKRDWLGAAERLVFDALRGCAPFVSPFSINNPEGWKYWLVHLASSYRAREVYNNVLHNCSSSQAHFGRSGLRMLHYDPQQANENSLYLFNEDGRSSARSQLFDDIPRFVAEFGNALSVNEFYSGIYNMTPAHSDDVRSAIIENQDLEVITPTGGERRKAHTIKLDDVVRLKTQPSFHFSTGKLRSESILPSNGEPSHRAHKEDDRAD